MRLPRLFGTGRDDSGGPLRLFLHIGMNKAGSTAIQAALADNAPRLKRHGLLYPETGRIRAEAHYLLSQVLGFSHRLSKAALEAGIESTLEPRIREEARRARCAEVVMSSEAFVIPGDIARVKAFFAGWDCRIVLYLRRHDHWWASSYSQGVASVEAPPWESGFESYLAVQRRRPDKGSYRLLIEAWAEHFGERNLIVRPYEREQNQPNIVADFLQAIGHPALAAELGGELPLRNESLGERELLLIDAIQRAGLDKHLRKQLVGCIRQRKGQRKGQGFVSPALRRELVEENLADYAWIARRFLGRGDGRLFLEPLPDPEAPWSAPEPLAMRELIEAIAAPAAGEPGRAQGFRGRSTRKRAP